MSRDVPFAIGIIAHAWWMRRALAWAMVLSSIVRADLVGATSLARTGVLVLLYVMVIAMILNLSVVGVYYISGLIEFVKLGVS